MDIGYSVSVKLIQGILAAAETVGLPAAPLLSSVGLKSTAIANPDERLPYSQWVALWQAIYRRTGNPSIGALLAEATQFESFNVAGYAMSHSPTLGKALDRLVRYSRLLYEGMEFTLIVNQGMATLTYQTVNAALTLPTVSIGWTLANIWLWIERSLSSGSLLTEVKLQQPPLQDTATYRRIFRTSLCFNSHSNALVFDARWLSMPLVGADSGLCELLDCYADSLLAKLPQSDELMPRLYHLLAEELRDREPTLESLSQKLGYLPRTLQRRLHKEGTSFQFVLDNLRRELAYQYLEDSQLTISEIALLLGFSENSAFNRAFRRWQDTAPGAYRKEQLFLRSVQEGSVQSSHFC